MKIKRLYANDSISFLDIINPYINTRIEEIVNNAASKANAIEPTSNRNHINKF